MLHHNPYYDPAAFGLKILHTIEDDSYDPEESFKLLVVWLHKASSKLYWATDIEWSNMDPFDDCASLADLHELGSGNGDEFAAAAVEFAYGFDGSHPELQRRVAELLSWVWYHFER